MESIKQSVTSAGTAISESLSGASATAQKENSKSTAQDSSQGVGTRLSAGADALSKKGDETAADAKKENAKQNI